MPTVRRIQRETSIGGELRGMRRAAATALSEGAGVEEARADKFRSMAHTAGLVSRIGIHEYARIVDEEREAADQTAITEASNKLSAWRNQALYDPERGALAKKGKDALPIPEEMADGFDKVTAEIETSLTSDKQRDAWAKVKGQEWQSLDLQVRRHTFQEVQQYRAGELKAHVENSVNAAIASAADPKLVEVELQKAVGALQKQAPGLGVGPEELENQIRGVQSSVHVGVISQLLAQERDKEASHYFEAKKTQIAGDKYDEIQKALEEGSVRGESQRQADVIGATGTLQEQLERARQIDDPKVRDSVEERLRRRDQDRRMAEDQEDRASQKTAYDILDRTADVTKIPATQWVKFDGGTRAAMRSYAKTRAKGEEIETDLPTYYDLINQAGADPATFASSNLLKYRTKLGEQEFKQLANLQLSIKNGDRNAAEKEIAPFMTRKELVDETLTLHNLNPNAKADSAEGRAIAQLRRMVDMRVAYLQADGKKATNQDIQAEIDSILSVKSGEPGSWWNIFPGGKPFFSTEKRLIDTTIDDIPDSERSQIEQALRSRNRPVSDATILDLYIETQLRRARSAK